ncbi:hypothetical protein EDB85DRAFT_1279079 [Lactarius pseudohatsudake]|nr:hypothetical protein EDB85DRAFT_1279079 [Lactarius pseudohatsudake]
MTKFLPDHLGGKKAILFFDAAEELFNMLHKPKVIPRYAPDAVTERVRKYTPACIMYDSSLILS